jgi:hypothetical protein
MKAKIGYGTSHGGEDNRHHVLIGGGNIINVKEMIEFDYKTKDDLRHELKVESDCRR